MLYENYQKRIKKIADVLRLMLRMWPLVLLVLLTVISGITALLITKGNVTSFECPTSVVYGESIKCESKAFLSRTAIEYSDASGIWTDQAPIMPGEYRIRAVAKGSFGIKKYSDVYSFTIEKKAVTVKSQDGRINYGEDPAIGADLEYGDILICEEFELSTPFFSTFEGDMKLVISALPIKESIIIKDKDGNDVTYAYEITVNREALEVIPRDITVTVEDKSKVYDGVALSFDGYELSDGSLSDGDILYAYFNRSIINVGWTENTVELIIVDGNGVDVSLCYRINVVEGILTIERRPIVISTVGGEFNYDGAAHTFEGYELSADTPLVPGQKLSVTPILFKDAGEYQNIPIVKIHDDEGTFTSNYSIIFEAGTVIGKPAPITVKTGDGTVTYNGRPFTFASFEKEVIAGTLYGYDMLMTSTWPSATDAGTYQNTTTYAVIQLTGRDVTHNYDITYEYGTVVIQKMPITVQTGSYSWMYDGEEHSYGEAHYTATATYDVMLITPITAITDVGKVKNELDIKIVRYTQSAGGSSDASPDDDHEYIDKTHNYEIYMHYGSISVYPRPIVVKPTDAEKVYDGTPLTSDLIEVTDKGNPLVLGHHISSGKTSGSITDVGTKTNYIVEGSVRIANAIGNDVTRNYEIALSVGALTVKPREILVETGSESKKYDGLPLTNADFWISIDSPYPLVSGHSIYVYNIGEITEVGKTENICLVDQTRILDASGRDVTANYLVNYKHGILEVYDDPDQSGGSGGGGGGGGLNESGDLGLGDMMNGGGGGQMGPALKVKDGKNSYLYLRLKSFGGYTGNSWNEATEYTEKINGIYSANYLTALALLQSSYKIEIEVLGDQYFLPYYMTFEDVGNYDAQSSDVIYSGDAQKIYSLYYKDYDYKSKYDLPSEYEEFERAYRSFVYSQYLIIDSETEEYMKGIIKKQGFVGNDMETILRVASYIQSSAKYNMEYDRDLDSEKNVAISFLDSYREGICQHYATAATLLFRAMGIPARYTIGFVAQTTANEWVEVSGMNAHAWVEVYIDGMGWIEIEVTGGGDFGHNGSGGSLGKETIIVKPEYQYKKYDGTPLVAQPVINTDAILRALWNQGYTYTMDVSGELYDIGIGESVPYNFKLYDRSGKDVTNNYNIVYENGILEILPPDTKFIEVELYQLQKYYDGTPISFTGEDYTFTAVIDNAKVDVSLNISLVDVGSLTLSDLNENSDQYAMLKISGVDDLTYYKVLFKVPEGMISYGDIPIRVDARPLTITASSATKEYDGEYLTSDDYYITKGSLCEGHTITVTIDGSIKQIGEEINMITSCTIFDVDGNDVTSNYDITAVAGLLTVTE